MIYVMGEQRSGVVKIGTAANPVDRLRQIQAGYPRPLVVQLAVPGGRREEAWLHEHFAHLRVSRREWFDFGDTDAVTGVVAALLARECDPELMAGEPVAPEESRRRRRADPAASAANGRPVYVLDEHDRVDSTGDLYSWRRDPDGCWVGLVQLASQTWQWVGAAALLPAPVDATTRGVVSP